jgi:hypothetical protein
MTISNTNIKPIHFPFATFNECHLHIDSWMPSGFLQTTIPDFFVAGKEHNFDHFIRDDEELSIFHGNEPVEHASKYFNYDDNTLENMNKLCTGYLRELETKDFKGYLEYELVQEVDMSKINQEIDIKQIDYDEHTIPNIQRISSILDETKIYYETHYTIPVELLRKNIQLFEKLNIRGVSLDKFSRGKVGVKHVVLTGLYEDIYSAISVFNFLQSLNLPIALKFEQKKFVLPIGSASLPKVFILKESVDTRAASQKSLQLQLAILQQQKYES